MNPFFKRVLLTGLLAGFLDMSAAYINGFVRTGHFSKRMFNYVAGGALGLKNALDGGAPVIILGIFFHYFIAFSFTLLFFLLYRKNRIFGLNQYLAAFLYGIFIWAVMNLVVLPLSALPTGKLTLGSSVTEALILVVAIGLPVSLSARAYYNNLPTAGSLQIQ